MALTIGALKRNVVGNVRQHTGTITLDSSYDAGGEAITPEALGLHTIESLTLLPSAGYNFSYNHSTAKVQAYYGSGFTTSSSSNPVIPPLVCEESVTVSSNTGTLARLPGYIISVNVTAGGTTGAFRVIPTGKTPTTTMVAVTFPTGVMTFLGTDAVTACKVCYIPLGVGPFVASNLVVDEAITLASAGGNLANQAALIQYAWNDTAAAASRLPAIQPVGEAPGANQIAIDVINAAATTLTVNAGQNGNSGLVTYWKKSAFGADMGFTDQADITVTSDAVVFGEALDLPGLWIPCFGNVVVGETGAAANLQSRILGPSGSTAANVCVWNPSKNTISFANGDAYATIEMAYVVLDPVYVPDLMLGSAGAEVNTGANLSAVVSRFQAYGV